MSNPYNEGKLMIGNVNLIRQNLGDIITKLIILMGYNEINPKDLPCSLTKKLSEIVCNIDQLEKIDLGQLRPILELLISKSQDTLNYLNTVGIEEAKLNAGLKPNQTGGKRKGKEIEKFLDRVIKFEKIMKF